MPYDDTTEAAQSHTPEFVTWANVEAELARVTQERDHLRTELITLERLLEATQAHLEREARTANHFHDTLEEGRRTGDAMTQTFNRVNDLLREG